MEEPKKFSAAEVASHSSKKDCWLTIHGKVYNVSEFLKGHPGGHKILIHASGNGDATESFEDVRHSSIATSMMSRYLIGVLDNYDPINVPKKATIHKASATTAQQQRRKPDTGLVDYIIALLMVGIAFAAWYYLTFLNKA